MSHYRDTALEVNLDHFIDNYHYFEKHSKKSVFTVVKANAYGLGALHIAQTAIDCGTDYLCTATLDEALELRYSGISHPILVMGYTEIKDVDIAQKHHITLTVPSLKWAQSLARRKIQPLTLHLKINTGMNRLGVNTLTEAQTVMNLLENHNIEGIFTHYYSKDLEIIQNDFNHFNQIVNELNYDFTWVHASNSYAALHFSENITNASRIGIGLFGGLHNSNLKNVASLKTKVTTIRTIDRHTTVSYDGLDTLHPNDQIAVLPIGYADGFSRLQQGQDVYINNKAYPIVGAICMDQMMVKIDSDVKLDDAVELFGERIDIETRAQIQNTITYEILTSISRRVVRKYFKNNTLIASVNYLLIKDEKNERND